MEKCIGTYYFFLYPTKLFFDVLGFISIDVKHSYGLLGIAGNILKQEL